MIKQILNRRPLVLLAGFFALTLALSSCQKETLADTLEPDSKTSIGSATDRNSNTIVDIAVSNPDFSTLVAAVLKTNSAELLSRPNLKATVFAPNNAAFAALPAPFNNAQNISNISDPKTINTLRQILRYHIVRGQRTAAQLTNGAYNTYAVAGTPGADQLYVGRSVSNAVFVNGNSQVIAADVQASNGVIHVINKVLFPPSQDIAQIAIYNGNFKALVAALGKTGLTNTLFSPTSNFTVFAPTDAAFAALPAPLNNAANISNITDANTINTLRNVLLYHLIPGRVFSVDLREGIQPETVLAPNKVTITLAGGPKVKGNGNANGSNIVLTDLLARNGVVHVIDQVLLP
jgi:uncharacterized surface protein with fasciclin (FAS1) repeats